MNIAVASMVRNEAHNYLPSALEAWKCFADRIIALDDNSTDRTRGLLAEHGATLIPWKGPRAWGAEAQPRKRLWEAAVESGCDWIFVLDADMAPARDPRPLLVDGVDGVAFPLYDLWTPDGSHYREDAYWRGHRYPRVWLVRNPGKGPAIWPDRGIHCGHFPSNLKLRRIITAPKDFALLHYAYALPEDRERKLLAYNSEGRQLTTAEWLHANSITDDNPNLLPLDVDITWPLRKES